MEGESFAVLSPILLVMSHYTVFWVSSRYTECVFVYGVHSWEFENWGNKVIAPKANSRPLTLSPPPFFLLLHHNLFSRTMREGKSWCMISTQARRAVHQGARREKSYILVIYIHNGIISNVVSRFIKAIDRLPPAAPPEEHARLTSPPRSSPQAPFPSGPS